MLFDISGENAIAWWKPKQTLEGCRHMLRTSETAAGQVKTLFHKGVVLRKRDAREY